MNSLIIYKNDTICIYIYRYMLLFFLFLLLLFQSKQHVIYIYTYTHYITLHYIALHCIALHCTALHCITLHTYITLHYITLQYSTVHYIHPCMHAYIHTYCVYIIYVCITSSFVLVSQPPAAQRSNCFFCALKTWSLSSVAAWPGLEITWVPSFSLGIQPIGAA